MRATILAACLSQKGGRNNRMGRKVKDSPDMPGKSAISTACNYVARTGHSMERGNSRFDLGPGSLSCRLRDGNAAAASSQCGKRICRPMVRRKSVHPLGAHLASADRTFSAASGRVALPIKAGKGVSSPFFNLNCVAGAHGPGPVASRLRFLAE